MSNPNPDPTNPTHYKRLTPEPIDVIEKWGLGFHLGNALKYIARAGHKLGVDAKEDLAKAAWYLARAGGTTESSLAFVELNDMVSELEDARRDAAQWKITARLMAERLRNLKGISDPDIELVLRGEIVEGARG